MKEVNIISASLFHDIHKYFEDMNPRTDIARHFLARMGTGWSDEVKEMKDQYGNEMQRAKVILDKKYIILQRR